MSYYNAICMKCREKRFIVPGTEVDNPRHEGVGNGHDGSQARDAAERNADHTPEPLDLHEPLAQAWMLANALHVIRERVPEAIYVEMETSDQDLYGFTLTALRSTSDGPDLLPDWADTRHALAGLRDVVNDQICDLDWDGTVGEDRQGFVIWNLLTAKVES